MAFLKTGSPQPIEVVEVCCKCGKNTSLFSENGELVCSSCRDKLEKNDECQVTE